MTKLYTNFYNLYTKIHSFFYFHDYIDPYYILHTNFHYFL